MLDIDDFKQVNDTYGHQQGDEVLVAVAGVLRELSRDIDEPARYGGEELAVVLPQTDDRRRGPAGRAHARGDRGAADPAAGRRGRPERHGELRRGLGAGSASDKASLIAAADAALYRAKRAGKNRVERAEPPSPR